MNNPDNVAIAIQAVIKTLMNRVMDKVLNEDPFIKEKHHSQKPLYAALVPDEIFKGSHFERRFVTPFGHVWEKLAQVVAKEAHGECTIGHSITGNIREERLRRIQETLNKLEHNQKGQQKVSPDWQAELAYVNAGGGHPIPVTVVCDLFIRNTTTDQCYAFELKGLCQIATKLKSAKKKCSNYWQWNH